MSARPYPGSKPPTRTPAKPIISDDVKVRAHQLANEKAELLRVYVRDVVVGTDENGLPVITYTSAFDDHLRMRVSIQVVEPEAA